MVKGWNSSIGKYFRSFHLEALALEIFSGVRISDFPSGARFYFDKGRTLIAQKNLDPAGFGDDLGKYIDTQEKIQEATAKFQLAYDRAIKAEDFDRRGYRREPPWVQVLRCCHPGISRFHLSLVSL